jgi:signal transduction histidine kinase/HAMP domain-containing protein
MGLGRRWRDVSIARKLYLVVGIMGVLMAAELMAMRFAIGTLSAGGSFAAGESLWSKAQKNALINLQRFARTRNEEDYQAFLGQFSISDGDRMARLELQKDTPDYALVWRGFQQGRINTRDIEPMIGLLRGFGWTPWVARTIAVWGEGDALIERFRTAGVAYHDALVAGDAELAAAAATELHQLNLRLTNLEDEFSYALGLGARRLSWLVLAVLGLAVLLAAGIGLTLATLISRRISRDLAGLNSVALRIGGGDFAVPTVSDAKDEIGQLARAIAQMGAMLQTSYTELESRVKARTQALARSRDQLGVILGGIADAITVVDEDGAYVYANEAGARMAGAPSVESFLATPQLWSFDIEQIFDEQGDPVPLDRLPAKLAFAGEEQPPEVLVRMRMHGLSEARWYLLKSAPVFDEARRARLVVTISKDVTEHRRAEETLEFLDDASQLLAASMDWKRSLRRVGELSVPNLGDRCAIEIVGDSGLASYTLYDSDPEQAAVEAPDESVLVVPLTARGRAFGAITLSAAASGRRYSATDRSIAGELARRAGTAIENALLYELAQKAIHVRDEFLSIASHELKTPLTSLGLQLELMRQKIDVGHQSAPPIDKIARVFDIAGRQVERLSRLVEDLLDVSRIEVGKLSFHFERVDLAELVRGVVGRFAEQLSKAGSALALEIEGEVLGPFDQIRVEQVVDNLLSNAVKYASGQPVTVSLARRGALARLVVQDGGPGIPPAERTRIFERFERGDASATRASGLGLGLFIAKEIVRGHGGSIRLESPEGSGARFVVELPVAAEASA